MVECWYRAMRKLTKILAAAVVVAMAGIFVSGRDVFWELIAGPADLGRVDFATLERPPTPNHYLACPEGLCVNAQLDLASPVYSRSAMQLQVIAREAWSDEPGLEMVASNPELFQDRYVQRTTIMRFPDTISVRFVEMEGNTASLAIYSRSQIGRSDLGVNKERVQRWLSLLDKSVGIRTD